MPEIPPAVQKSDAMPSSPSDEPKRETKQSHSYTLKFEPDKDFNETTLFVKGFVTGKVWITGDASISLKSLTGEEVDKINESVTVKEGMSLQAYQTELTYWNLAHSITEIRGEPFTGSVSEKLGKLRKMSTVLLNRMALAYLEFNLHISDLFNGKEATEVAKKS